MRYIEKTGTHFEDKGVKVCQKFLDSRWDARRNCYPQKVVYKANKLSDLRQILVDEQTPDGLVNGVCCYCMRKLYTVDSQQHTFNVTLEHVIPQRIKEGLWNKHKNDFQSFDCLKDDKVTVCYGGELSDDKTQITQIPHPHYVSYHNLVASCDGETFCKIKKNTESDDDVDTDAQSLKIVSNCCNLKRGEQFIMPIFFYSDIEQRFGYDKEGKLEYPDEFDDLWFDKDHLNLSCDWLNGVRKFWYEFSQLNQYSEDSVEKAITDEKLRVEILEEVDPVNTMFQGFNNDRLWVILSEYSWFYNYYKNKEAA